MLRPLRHTVVPLLVLVLAACGSSSGDAGASGDSADGSYPGRSAQQLFDASKTAMGAQKAVTVRGTTALKSGGTSYEATVMKGGVSGKLTSGTSGMQFRRIGDLTYIKAGADFFDAQEAGADAAQGAGALTAKIGNRWLVADSATLEAMASMGGGTSSEFAGQYRTVADILAVAVPTGATLTRVAGTNVGGSATTGLAFTGPVPPEEAARIGSTGGTVPSSVTGTVFVATAGSPLPVAIRNNLGVDLTLGDWGRTVPLAAPPKKDQIRLEDLLKGTNIGG